MIIILLVAAAVSGVTAAYSGESFADVFIILIVVLINAVLGVYQESKAEKAIEALQEMTAATSKVIRGGKQVSLKSEELVPGDVVVLEAGDAVPADGRILESASLKIEEAALTGESVPVNKVVSALGLDDGKDVPPGRPQKHGLYGQHRSIRPRTCPHHGHRYGHRDGQDRRRAGAGRRGTDSAAEKSWRSSVRS